MAKSLKEDNKRALLVMALSNIALLYGAIQTGSLLGGDPLLLLRGWKILLPTGLGLTLLGIFNAQLDANIKARVVFLRWTNPLPGSEAFTRHGPADPRVDMEALTKALGPLPEKPELQNKLWYRLYMSASTNQSIIQAHRDFLFARDYAALSIMILPILGSIGFYAIPSTPTATLYVFVLFGQFLMASRATRTHGRRFVTTVLALKSVGK